MITESNRTYRFRRADSRTDETVETTEPTAKPSPSAPRVQHVYDREEKHETQASRIIERFGNPYKLSKALKAVGHSKNPTSIYRWMYPKDKGGCGGVVPTAVWPFLLKAARLEGIMLEEEEISPRESIASRKTLVATKDTQTGVTTTYEKKSNYQTKYRRKVIP